MHLLNSKYNKIRAIDIKNKSDILKFLPMKMQIGANNSLSKKLDGNAWYNMKTKKITVEDEKIVYQIINRDVLGSKNMKKVELGSVFQIGQFVRGNKKRHKTYK